MGSAAPQTQNTKPLGWDRVVVAATNTTTTKVTVAGRTVKSGATTYVGAAVVRDKPKSSGSLAGPVTFTATPAVGTAITFNTTTTTTGLAAWSPKLPDGTYSITAQFAGNTGFLGSTSKPVPVKVGSGAPPPLDTDADRLADAVETNTGIYVSPTNTGTDPAKADTDGDAISDGDEVLGTTAGLNLPALGFKALHKDLAFEFDWMDDATACGAHSHRVVPASIAKVAAAYAAGPVVNPDGTTGVHFIADYGQGSGFTGGNLVAGAADGHIDGDFTADFVAIKAANFAAKRNGYFHYNLQAHNEPSFPGSAGVGQLGGDDIITTMECSYADVDLFANVLFHEGGHNLGLQHGGFEGQNFKPNYPSVMNYGMAGPDTNCDGVGDGGLGYSSGTEIDLDENALIEDNGVCGPGHPIDWNQNSVIDAGPIAFNLNPQEGPGLSILKDYNDWANLSFAGILDAD
jgi:hypothetical protein